ncbi:RelA/SpoT family protein [Brachymonas denitrificans]|uniref:RelA/SpoT family protein n=1 Tax=Brachymonas denitrificans TaxID=28220 RepID=UPI001BCE03F3|nr:bifunctional (p)ppGpp synthetase/guanosine-3',5'-bis(diphosphate) 3'-pyrophosphohydrolase [Brachymonas denitrificans]
MNPASAPAGKHSPDDEVAGIVQASSDTLPTQADVLTRARQFAGPLLVNCSLPSGENELEHADGVAKILEQMGGAVSLQAVPYLVYAADHLSRPQEMIEQAFGDEYAQLALQATRLMRLQQSQRVQPGSSGLGSPAEQVEAVRKMLLAFSRDLRVILLRLASRLQTLRHYAATKLPVPHALAYEALHVLAPLANRLGIWQIKWEMEDLAFRFLEPDTYRSVARLLDEKRTEREQRAEELRRQVREGLAAQGITASVQARPKHIFSIVKKMRGKGLDFEQIYDRMALRVIVPEVKDCYAALSWVHSQHEPIPSEFDDYIAKPKANGYQSLHTVIRQLGEDGRVRPVEIQIRTQDMHDHAESGVAAHWAYKEAGAKGYAGHSANSAYDAKIAVLRQLLAWEREFAAGGEQAPEPEQPNVVLDDKIYVLTPEAAIVELPQGATPVDFAYSVHTTLGHRCRGAKVDGAMVPLNTPLRNGQTVSITAAKEGGPSRDWLNVEQGYLVSNRARAKVRAWFNALALQDAIARGRDAVEKLLQREGKTAVKLDDLAGQLGFSDADALFEVVGKDEFSLRNIEAVLKPQAPQLSQDEILLQKQAAKGDRKSHRPAPKGGVLVVGMGSLMTQLAKCCKPAPPDAIGGFVTRGKGVSVHRADCPNYRSMVRDNPERAIEVQWQGLEGGTAAYPVDILVQATDRAGLLRDISELFAREKMPVVGLHSDAGKEISHMMLTVQVSDTHRLNKVLGELSVLDGILGTRRR